jgi:hypothetical protein
MVALDRLVWGWSEQLVSLTLVTIEGVRTIGPGPLFTCLGAFQNYSGGAMAASIFTVLAFVLVRRRFVYRLADAPVKFPLEAEGAPALRHTRRTRRARRLRVAARTRRTDDRADGFVVLMTTSLTAEDRRSGVPGAFPERHAPSSSRGGRQDG